MCRGASGCRSGIEQESIRITSRSFSAEGRWPIIDRPGIDPGRSGTDRPGVDENRSGADPDRSSIEPRSPQCCSAVLGRSGIDFGSARGRPSSGTVRARSKSDPQSAVDPKSQVSILIDTETARVDHESIPGVTRIDPRSIQHRSGV